MGDFVMTKCAQSNCNAQDDFVAFTYTGRRAKTKVDAVKTNSPDEEKELTFTDAKKQQELEMKRLRWDVMKFGSSSLEGSMKHKAKVSHAIQLGAKLPKKRKNDNYKELKMKAKWEKVKIEKMNNQQSGILQSLKKPKKIREKRVRNDILDVYGKVNNKGEGKK